VVLKNNFALVAAGFSLRRENRRYAKNLLRKSIIRQSYQASQADGGKMYEDHGS
jgi:hypothetical protein